MVGVDSGGEAALGLQAVRQGPQRQHREGGAHGRVRQALHVRVRNHAKIPFSNYQIKYRIS